MLDQQTDHPKNLLLHLSQQLQVLLQNSVLLVLILELSMLLPHLFLGHCRIWWQRYCQQRLILQELLHLELHFLLRLMSLLDWVSP